MPALGLALLVLAAQGRAAPAAGDSAETGTFSIVARDAGSGELGLAVQSKALAVGSRVPTVKGGLASIAHQAASNPMYGALGVPLLQAGMSPQQALDLMLGADEGRDRRQVAILDAGGRSAAWTGPAASDWKGHRCAVDYCVQGNILAGPQVIEAMAKAFEAARGPLAERMLAALDAGQAAGGDARGTQSAALIVARPLAGAAGFGDRVVDLRVDDHRQPLVEIRRILARLRSNEHAAEAERRLARGDTGGALEAATAARDVSDENDEAWVMLAAARLRAGARPDAVAALRRAVELNPALGARLPADPRFEPLRADPDFQALTRPRR